MSGWNQSSVVGSWTSRPNTWTSRPNTSRNEPSWGGEPNTSNNEDSAPNDESWVDQSWLSNAPNASYHSNEPVRFLLRTRRRR